MNVRLIGTTALLATVLAGCENALPILANVAGSTVAKTSGASDADAREIGMATENVVRIIATHEATERQRQIAEQNAIRVYQAFLDYQEKQPQKRTHMRTIPRRIAVDTERDQNSKGKKFVMNYDTKTQKIEGNKVYVLSKQPEVGTHIKIPTESAKKESVENIFFEYQGDGSSTKAFLNHQ